MTSPYLLADLKLEEGFRSVAYPDPLSGGEPYTIGWGHAGRDVHPGLVWTQVQCADALASDVAETCRGLDTALPWWRGLDDMRQDVLVDLAFNLGVHGLMGFTTFLGLVKATKFAAAATDLGATKWASEVGCRAERLVAQMNSGQHEPY